MTDVAILGCGPAGLMAAHAVAIAGHRPVIYSQKRKSEIFGAQFLHKQLPYINPQTNDGYAFEIDIVKTGTKEGYAKNVYGDANHEVSWDKFNNNKIIGFDLRATYDALWDLYVGRIEEWWLDERNVGSIAGNYPLVLSTIPATRICGKYHSGHAFHTQPIAINKMYGGLINDKYDNLIYYNGYPPDGSEDGIMGPAWYRYSQIKSHRAWEYAAAMFDRSMFDDEGEIVFGEKPQSTNCDCWLEYPSFKRLGRFGKWQRDVLTHHAFEEAQIAVQSM